jgi:hypothetical protein
MKIRFFADSWCWCWPFGRIPVKSKKILTMKEGYTGVPILKWYFDGLGITTKFTGRPGQSLKDTECCILEVTDDFYDYNVVVVTSPYRMNQIKELNIGNYNEFIDQWNNETVTILKSINDWAVKYNQTVFLVGGHMTLSKDIFDKIGHTTHLHLLSECMISDLAGVDPKFGIFKFADFTEILDKTFDVDLVDHVWNDITTYDKNQTREFFTYPDYAHLNATGSLFLVDLILSKIEELQGE